MSGDVAALRAVAEAATPGPWGFGGSGVATDYWDGRPEFVIAKTDWTAENGLTREWMDHNRVNGTYIATFDPPTVLGLLDRLEAAEAKVARVEDLAAELQHLSLPGMTDWDYGEMILAALTGEDQ